jgi:hypothetical protein
LRQEQQGQDACGTKLEHQNEDPTPARKATACVRPVLGIFLPAHPWLGRTMPSTSGLLAVWRRDVRRRISPGARKRAVTEPDVKFQRKISPS